MKVVQRKIKKSGKDRKRIGRGGSAYILDKRRITAVQNMKREAEKEKLRERFAAAANMPKDKTKLIETAMNLGKIASSVFLAIAVFLTLVFGSTLGQRAETRPREAGR